MTKQLGFASRSEFFRALIRWVTSKPLAKEEVRVWPFIAPSVRSKKEILTAFKRADKYSKAFLKDLAEGLENSDYFSE